ncbi:DNA polymerase III subunit gamma/tau [Melissococcus plutonius]|uniref:DNA polymerase III subunit gamma/tau n=1 Tax=Melissococcus plutonius TaxID=33970 RepID=UPI00065E7D0B|nr:DNA polymerase III subunit gamma/tau [Melissococcus plutonius]KMT32833.1 DNA polymerase III subunit gamma/tau [Melissococcus plutonius]KMT34492.1 DNA polymerase III subunit gamma/tau [Melissococcus plutonius]BBD14911.1 DNA polymerase III subunits gamma and tau [Melissococcus plutonius]
MSYQALYRVWRSQRFDDIVGQKAITQTLKNAIAQKKTSHAYLFTGPRGTGKTSAAKIFAKAINCKHNDDGEPCNICDVCLAITSGSLNDVIEIDAASNNGVEEIRDIQDKVKYAPTSSDYKVYIIDEVHMLSTGAFNALLKTLEEPPPNVVFILATTEPHKIPATIISRTQRFDFRRINVHDIVHHLAFILKETSIEYEEQALYTVAQTAEGGMRDALSILDQIISFNNKKVTVEDARRITGSLTDEMMDQYIEYCLSGEAEKALESLEGMFSAGKEANRLVENLLLYCRDLLMYQQAPTLLTEKVGNLTETFKQLAQETSAEKIYTFIQILSDTQNDIRFTNNTAIYLEVATVKLANTTKEAETHSHLKTESPIEKQQIAELSKQIEQIQNELTALKKNQVILPEKNRDTVSTNKQKYYAESVSTEQIYQVLTQATKQHLQQVKEVWDDMLQMLTVTQRAMIKASEPVAASSNGLIVVFDYEIVCSKVNQDQALQLAIQNNLSRLIDYAPLIVCITRESWPKTRQAFIQQNKNEFHSSNEEKKNSADNTNEVSEELTEEKIEADPVVEKALEIFGKDFTEIIHD